MQPKNKSAINFNADDVWSASVAAHRINGGYIKAIAPGLNQTPNRDIVYSLLADPTSITSDDRSKAEIVRLYFKGQMFKVIEGKPLNDFMKSAMEFASLDKIDTSFAVAVIASLPATYEKNSKRDEVDRRIKFAHGGYVGDVGAKVKLTIEVVKRLWSEKFFTWYITGITPDNQSVFFAFKKDADIGEILNIEGKVKSHRDVSTQLSHVKVK